MNPSSSLTLEISARREINQTDLRAMHTLRAKVFHDRMGWDVPIMSGMEIDGYDAIDPFYMLMRGKERIVCGCWRILPTVGPYMLKDTFAQLLHGEPAPEDPKVWELSRFAIETDGQQAFGFSEITLQSIDEILAFGHRAGIERYVTVTTTAIERMLRTAGLVVRRFGPPVRIGVENAIALYFDTDECILALQKRRGKLPATH